MPAVVLHRPHLRKTVRIALVVGTILFAINDLPRRRRLHGIVVPDRQHTGQAREVGAVSVAAGNLPGQRPVTDTESGRSARLAIEAAARAHGLAVAALKIRAPHAPIGDH